MARAQADERRKMLLLDYGDPKLAKTFYGARHRLRRLGGGEPVLGACSAWR